MKSVLAQTIGRLSLATIIVCVVLCSGCRTPNNYPVINSLDTEKDWLEPSDSCRVECVATDADGDSLDYTWSATAGSFSGEGPVVTWMAPHMAGTCTITVNVTDGRGGEATKEMTIDVVVNHPPVIESLTANPAMVKQSESSIIECVASDPDGDDLGYLWSVDRGSISGEGSRVTWTAPMTCGTYVITVTVVDNRGGEVNEELGIKVIKPG